MAMLAVPAGAQGAAKFGLDLSDPISPDNSVPAHACGNPSKSCTRVGVEYPDGGAGT